MLVTLENVKMLSIFMLLYRYFDDDEEEFLQLANQLLEQKVP